MTTEQSKQLTDAMDLLQQIRVELEPVECTFKEVKSVRSKILAFQRRSQRKNQPL